eukprot:49431-Rhodomonas_salina.3
MLNLPAGKASTLSGHTGPVLAARFNSDGNYCLTCGQDRVLKLWNPVKGKAQPPNCAELAMPMPCLHSLPALRGLGGQHPNLPDLSSPVVEFPPLLPPSEPPHLPAPLYLVCHQFWLDTRGAAALDTLWEQDVPTGQVIRKYKGHELKVNTVKFAGDDDSVVVSGSYDKTVRIFDCRSASTAIIFLASIHHLRT